MANQDEMLKALESCDDVIDREVKLLGQWALAASFGRAAACSQAANLIAIGNQSPKAAVHTVLLKAHALSPADVKSPPTAARKAELTTCLASVSSREGQNVNTLLDPDFFQALLEAQTNSRHAAILAGNILKECT